MNTAKSSAAAQPGRRLRSGLCFWWRPARSVCSAGITSTANLSRPTASGCRPTALLLRRSAGGRWTTRCLTRPPRPLQRSRPTPRSTRRPRNTTRSPDRMNRCGRRSAFSSRPRSCALKRPAGARRFTAREKPGWPGGSARSRQARRLAPRCCAGTARLHSPGHTALRRGGAVFLPILR